MGDRIQGVLVRTRPPARALDALAERYPLRLYEVAESPVWIVDFAIGGTPDRTTVRLSRALARNYVDAIRVLNTEDHELEQLGWLMATAEVARVLDERALGLLSDDGRFDFAASATPEHIATIGDHVAPYLLRWEAGELTVQGYVAVAGGSTPHLPEELALVPSVAVLPPEPLPGGTYPIHGNVRAELHEFAPAAAGIIADWAVGTLAGALHLVETRGPDSSYWEA